MGTVTPILNNHEPYYRVGGDFSFNYRTFNVYGLYMYGHDSNNLPVDSTGALIPLPLGPEARPPPGLCGAFPPPSAGASYKPIIWCSPGSWRSCDGTR